jgi:hypothetical protein
MHERRRWCALETHHALTDLASRIYDCEQQGHQLSAGWYDFAHAETRDVEQLKQYSSQSLELLQTLSQQLSQQLQSQASPSSLEHAYNIVQELISSRTATQEMLENILKHDTGFQEYFRALALKEKAAVGQAEQLNQALANLQ